MKKRGKEAFSDRNRFGLRNREELRRMTYKGEFLYGPMRKRVIEELMVIQNERCAICDDLLQIPHVDHNHVTMEIRGLLCSPCNTGIGGLKGDEAPDRCLRAYEYLTGIHLPEPH